MAARRIIFRKGEVRVNDNGIIVWKRFSRYWSSVMEIHRLPHRKGPVIFTMIREKAVDQTVELYMIFETPPN